MLLGAREQECLLFGERQPVMAAAGSVIQDGGRFAIPFRQRARDPTYVVKIAINDNGLSGSRMLLTTDRFVGTRCCSSQHCANGEADNFTYPHFDSFCERDIYVLPPVRFAVWTDSSSWRARTRKQSIDPSRKVFRKARANIILDFPEARRLYVPGPHVLRISAPVCIRHEPQLVVMKVCLGMEKQLDVAPILGTA